VPRVAVPTMGNRRLTKAQLVQSLGQAYTALQRLRSEFRIVNLRHPIAYSLAPASASPVPTKNDEQMVASVSLMIPNVKSRVILSFGVGRDVLRTWPAGLRDVDVGVEVVYGSAE
jgi:kinetochore protein Spc7/SPC105